MNAGRPVWILAVLVCSSRGLRAKDLCSPVGWATREGRTAVPFALTGGGKASPIVVTSLEQLQTYANDSLPRVLHLSDSLGQGWSGDMGDRLVITGSDKTIVGLKPGTFLNAAIRITGGARNIVLRNVVVRGAVDAWINSWEPLSIEGMARNIWVDHCEFWDGPDGNADVVKGADNVTFTWNIFGYTKNGIHNLSNLVGSSDNEPVSEGKFDITFLFNHWTGASQRLPRCRYGEVHVSNNLFTRDGMQSDFGIAAGWKCEVLAENNHFIGINNPIHIKFRDSISNTSACEATGNLFEGTIGTRTGFGKAFVPPYEYKSYLVDATEVEDLVGKNAGATLESPTSCGNLSRAGFPPAEVGRVSLRRRDNLLEVDGSNGEPVEILLRDMAGDIRYRQIMTHERLEVDLSLVPLEQGVFAAATVFRGRISSSLLVHLVR